MRIGSSLSAFLIVFALIASLASAQSKRKGEETTRSVQGIVTSATGDPIQGAVVQLKNTKTLEIRSYITKENGSYQFQGLSPDIDYDLTATFQGDSSGSKTLSSFDSRKQATLNLKLTKKSETK